MKHSLPEILDCYSRLILAVTDDENLDPLWKRFYQIQMATWLLTRKNLHFDMNDAIGAYNLISKTWDDLCDYMNESILPVKNFDNVFKMVNIPFEETKDKITLFDNNDSLLSQFDSDFDFF